MESFLLFCNAVLMALAVLLTVLDGRRRPGARQTNPFRPAEEVVMPKAERPARKPGGRWSAR